MIAHSKDALAHSKAVIAYSMKAIASLHIFPTAAPHASRDKGALTCERPHPQSDTPGTAIVRGATVLHVLRDPSAENE
jgi:hypothetical protein